MADTSTTDECPISGLRAQAQYVPICTSDINASPNPQLMYLQDIVN